MDLHYPFNTNINRPATARVQNATALITWRRSTNVKDSSSLTRSCSSSSSSPPPRCCFFFFFFLHQNPPLTYSDGRDGFGGRSLEGVRQGQRSPRQAVPQARPQGVHKGGGAHGHWVRGDGFRWVLRQADLYPHQQYHRWIRLIQV